ncbi:4972_t:CDS:2, partial [Funneliformis geosporum]
SRHTAYPFIHREYVTAKPLNSKVKRQNWLYYQRQKNEIYLWLYFKLFPVFLVDYIWAAKVFYEYFSVQVKEIGRGIDDINESE